MEAVHKKIKTTIAILILSTVAVCSFFPLQDHIKKSRKEHALNIQQRNFRINSCIGKTVENIVWNGRYLDIWFKDGRVLTVRGRKYSLRVDAK